MNFFPLQRIEKHMLMWLRFKGNIDIQTINKRLRWKAQNRAILNLSRVWKWWTFTDKEKKLHKQKTKSLVGRKFCDNREQKRQNGTGNGGVEGKTESKYWHADDGS